MPECRFLSALLLLPTLWSAAARESAALPSIAGIRQQQAPIRPLENNTVIHPAGTEPFSVPEISTGAMRGFEVRQFTGSSRHRLTGTITFIEPGSHIFLQADNRGVRAGLAAGQTAAVGDLVEASGFVRMNGSFAELTHTLIRHPGTPPPPGPEPLTVSASKHRGTYALQLVERPQPGRRAQATARDALEEADQLGDVVSRTARSLATHLEEGFD